MTSSNIARRSFLTGAAALLCAPAIAKAAPGYLAGVIAEYGSTPDIILPNIISQNLDRWARLYGLFRGTGDSDINLQRRFVAMVQSRPLIDLPARIEGKP